MVSTGHEDILVNKEGLCELRFQGKGKKEDGALQIFGKGN